MKLKFSDPVKYRITLADISIKSHELYRDGKFVDVNSFLKPVTENLTFKVYIVKYNQEIIYVGITSQGIGTRFGQGFRAKGEQGYYGYQWKNIEEKLEILIWSSNFKYKERFDDTHKEQSKIMEGIEGEIVYQFRKENKLWPDKQNEIHFHNIDKEYKDFAKMIYNKSK